MGLPLLVEDRPLGLLGLASTKVEGYGPRHAELAAAFAAQAALALENERLIRQTRELAALEERQRLARDLHDVVSQTLFSASLIAEVLPRVWERNQEMGRESLRDLHQLTRGALAEMRTLLMELRPTSLLELDLDELLPQLGEVVTGRSRIPVKLDLDEPPRLPADVRINLYRIAQEALSNVAKHSNATQATVTLRSPASGGVELKIDDDGQGFDPDNVAANSLGLDIMRERAVEIGALLRINSRPGEGTSISAHWRPKVA
jgi:two-component system nitrate/nitrite sensor histidine kinase NarX